MLIDTFSERDPVSMETVHLAKVGSAFKRLKRDTEITNFHGLWQAENTKMRRRVMVEGSTGF